MAGGPFLPTSAFPIGTSGEVFPNVFVGDGGGSPHAAPQEEGLGVAATITGDRAWSLRFQMPTTLPTGTAIFRLVAVSDVQSGDLSVVPSWVSVAMDQDGSALSLNSEGPDPDSRVGGNGSNADNSTFGWDTGDDDVYLEARWTLNADTVVAGEIIQMELLFVDADSDVAQVVTLFPSIIFV